MAVKTEVITSERKINKHLTVPITYSIRSFRVEVTRIIGKERHEWYFIYDETKHVIVLDFFQISRRRTFRSKTFVPKKWAARTPRFNKQVISWRDVKLPEEIKRDAVRAFSKSLAVIKGAEGDK